MSAQSISELPPTQRASFATSSRLLSCLVTESLLTALYVPVSDGGDLIGTAIVLTSSASKHEGPYAVHDVFVLIPLRNVPIFKARSTTEIALLDPLDMLPFMYEIDVKAPGAVPTAPNGHADIHEDGIAVDMQRNGIEAQHIAVNGYASLLSAKPTLESHLLTALSQSKIRSDANAKHTLTLIHTPGPLHLWKKFADGYNIDEEMQESVAEELRSSVAWQQHSYEHPPPIAPTFDSPSIAWEQSIIEGHPTHPMHKARRAMPPLDTILPGAYDWQHPAVRIIAVPRSRVTIQGHWDDLVAPVVAAAVQNAVKSSHNTGEHIVSPDYTLIPIHGLQVPNIKIKFPEARILPEAYTVPALAQQSLRSVILPTAYRTLGLKLAFGIRLTSAVRTISPPSAFLGPRFSSVVVPRLTYDRKLLIVQRELASVSHVHPDPEIAKHMAGIVREAYENTCVEDHGERAIVCTALVELGYGGKDEVPLVQSAFGLDTEAKRIAWFDTFVDLYFKAFLPSVLANGVAFEAHPQNTLARFDVHTRQLTGFVIRDFGGLRIHPPSVIASTGLSTLDDVIAPGHSIIADTLEDVHTRLYHTLIHNLLQQLIRVLKLHYNGKGWAIVRKRLREQIPADHDLSRLWLSPETETLPGKCFMRMRLQGMYRTHLHGPFSNLIHYRGVEDQAITSEQ